MNKINILKKGDYVLATRWSDGDPQDAWCVGFYGKFNGETRSYEVSLSFDSIRSSRYRKVKKISKKRGEFLLKNKELIESGSKSLWWWSRQSISKNTLK